jgi:hypothetical protein
MSEAKRYSTTVGWVGVLCLAVYWIARFAPDIADTFASSSFGKLIVFGALPTGVLLATIAAFKGSRWWWVVVAAGVFNLAELYFLISRFPLRY